VSRLGDWLEERVGWRAALAHALVESIRGGASWAYVFGSVLVFLLLTQAVTGVVLAVTYVPSVTDAWGSVAYLQDQISWGWFVRGLHAEGASATLVVAGLHILQVTLWGAYRRPREVNWWLGLLLLLLLFGFGLTGYLLPWDQKGYWATRVATGIAGQTPFVGDWLQRFLQGGNEYGQLTLTRFFALHVLVLPAVTLAVAVLHVKLFRRHGVTPRWGKDDAPTQPFWPDQLFRDVVAMALTFAVLAGLVWRAGGAHLAAPADPASNYDARPEWYFLPLFQLLKIGGPLERVVALGAPLVVFGILAVLPFLDRAEGRAPRRRLLPLGLFTLVGAGAISLGLMARVSDGNDAALVERQAAAEVDARRARELAKLGIPPGGSLFVWENDPAVRAARVFGEECAGCHTGKDLKGPAIGPGYNSRAWIRAYLLDPQGARFFGRTKQNQMKPTKLDGPALDEIVEMIYAETGAADADAALTERGRQRFDASSCSDCHARDGTTGDDIGPNLGGRGTEKWFVELLEDPGGPRHFGEKNEMPSFARTISSQDRQALAKWLVSLRGAD
jgi:ubiquinol-cytochrome c reductase cytochrome b subunit